MDIADAYFKSLDRIWQLEVEIAKIEDTGRIASNLRELLAREKVTRDYWSRKLDESLGKKKK
jgi:hypothetical protein